MFTQVLGVRWVRNNRLYFFKHISLWDYAFMGLFMFWYKDAIMANIDRLSSDTDNKQHAFINM